MFRRLCLLVSCAVLLGATRAPKFPLTPFELRAPVGTAAPAMKLQLLDGTVLDTATLRGRPTYVVLIASWCEPCVRSVPNLRADAARFGDRVQFLAIDVYETRERAAAFAEREKLPFPVAIYTQEQLDATISLERRLAAGTHFQIPADVLFDAGGIVRAAWYGVFDTPDGAARDDLPGELAKLGIE